MLVTAIGRNVTSIQMTNKSLLTPEVLLQKLDEIETEMRVSGHWANERTTDLAWWLAVLEYFQFEKIPKDRQLLTEGKLPVYQGQWVYDINHDCLRTPSLRSWVKLVLAYNDMLPAENEYGEKQKNYDRDFQKRYPLYFVDALTDAEATSLDATLLNIEKILRENGGWDEQDFYPIDFDLPASTKLLHSLQYQYIPEQKRLLKVRQLPRPLVSLERDLKTTFRRNSKWDSLRLAVEEHQVWLRKHPTNLREIEKAKKDFEESHYLIPVKIEAEEMTLLFAEASELCSLKKRNKKDKFFRDEIALAQAIDIQVMDKICRTHAKTALEVHFNFKYPYAFAEVSSDQDPEDNVPFSFLVVADKISIDSLLEK